MRDSRDPLPHHQDLARRVAAGLLVLALGIAAAIGFDVFVPHGNSAPIVARQPASGPASVVAGLNCRVAIFSGEAGTSGWVSFPSGRFTADPRATVYLPDIGLHAAALSYQVSLDRWLPVRREWITPDGRGYAYLDTTDRSVRLVGDDGLATLFATPSPGETFTLLGVEPEGIYVDTDPGLLLWTWTGQRIAVTATGHWQAIGGGRAYGIETEPTPSTLTAGADTVVGLDLVTGETREVFSAPGLTERVVGFAAGWTPVIEATDDQRMEVWLASSTPRLVLSERRSQLGDRPPTLVSVLADSYGTWLAASGGLYLYTPSGRLEKASSVTAWLASGCIDAGTG